MSEDKQYIVSARKYRPPTFRSVVGQKALTQTLKNAIDSNRLAHAYLFCGPRGVGKTSCARIFAKTINCLHPSADGEACGECESCRAIERGASFNLIELDAASNNGINEMREFIEQVRVPPQTGKYRVFIIDEVHMLTTQAFNAFLKTLEEPPAYVIFILATTEKHKVLPTILSRCQIYDFKRITIADMVEHLAYVAQSEGMEAESSALNVIARKADGAMRDALSIFDQVAASSRGKITYESAIDNLNVLDYDYFFRLTDAFANGDVSESLLIYKEIRDKGFDSLFFVNGLASHIRDLMVAFDSRTLPLLEVGEEVGQKYTARAHALPVGWYHAAMRLLNDCDVAYRTSGNKQLLVELTLIRLCQLLAPEQIKEQPVKPMEPVKPAKPAEAVPAEQAPKVNATQVPAQNPAVQNQTVRPAVRPVQQVRPAAAAGARPRSFRLNDAAVQPQGEQEAPSDRAFGPEDFIKTWQEFAAANSDRHILVSAMRGIVPEAIDEVTYLVKVSHPAQQQAFESEMNRLVGYLRERLGNARVSLRTELDKTVEVQKKLSPVQLLQAIVKENPIMGEVLTNIDAELI